MNTIVRSAALVSGLLLAAGCASEGVTAARAKAGQGMLAVALTDAPTPLDSIKEVNVFVVRIDARRAHTDSAEVDDSVHVEHHEVQGGHEGEHPDSTQWVTIATPGKAFNLLALQNGVTAFLGATPLDTGHFRGARLVIDPAKSNIVLKDGTVLSTTSTPPVEFERKGEHGLFVEMTNELNVNEAATTTLTLDLKLNQSLSMRGHTLRDGFLFRPVIAGQSKHDH